MYVDVNQYFPHEPEQCFFFSFYMYVVCAGFVFGTVICRHALHKLLFYIQQHRLCIARINMDT